MVSCLALFAVACVAVSCVLNLCCAPPFPFLARCFWQPPPGLKSPDRIFCVPAQHRGASSKHQSQARWPPSRKSHDHQTARQCPNGECPAPVGVSGRCEIAVKWDRIFLFETLAVLHTFRSHEKFSNPPQLGSETFFPTAWAESHFPVGAPVSPL